MGENHGIRTYSSTQGVDDVMGARIYSGFHYRTSMATGARIGRQAAQFVVHQALR